LFSRKQLDKSVRRGWNILTSDSTVALNALQKGDIFPKDMVEDLLAVLKFGELNDIPIQLDASVIRGQEYYNSLTFQIDLLLGDKIITEVGGGGTYDFFINRMLHDTSCIPVFPATGFAFSLERIAYALKYLDESMDAYEETFYIPMATKVNLVVYSTDSSIALKKSYELRQKHQVVAIAPSSLTLAKAEDYAKLLHAKFLNLDK
jgi:histidyl-tRNA synthetase